MLVERINASNFHLMAIYKKVGKEQKELESLFLTVVFIVCEVRMDRPGNE